MWCGLGKDIGFVWMIAFRENYEIKWQRGPVSVYEFSNALYTQGIMRTLHWRHIGCDCVSNHQPYDCLLNRLFRRRSKKTSKLRVNGLCEGPVNSPHKWPVTRKMFPFDEVIMSFEISMSCCGSALANLIFHVAFAGIWKSTDCPCASEKPWMIWVNKLHKSKAVNAIITIKTIVCISWDILHCSVLAYFT